MEGLRASWVLCCVGVACKDNSKVVRCNAGAGEVGCGRLVLVCGEIK